MKLYETIVELDQQMQHAKILFEESLLGPIHLRAQSQDRQQQTHSGSIFSPDPRAPSSVLPSAADGPSTEDYVSALFRFYEKREQDWFRISSLNEQLQVLHRTLFTQTTHLAHRLQRFVFLFDTRPVLTKALVEMHRLLQQSVRSIRHHDAAAEARQLTASEARAMLMTTADVTESALQGNRWVLANFFTQDELHHLGCSPSHFLPDDGNSRPTWRDLTLPSRGGRLVGLLIPPQQSQSGHHALLFPFVLEGFWSISTLNILRFPLPNLFFFLS